MNGARIGLLVFAIGSALVLAREGAPAAPPRETPATSEARIARAPSHVLQSPAKLRHWNAMSPRLIERLGDARDPRTTVPYEVTLRREIDEPGAGPWRLSLRVPPGIRPFDILYVLRRHDADGSVTTLGSGVYATVYPPTIDTTGFAVTHPLALERGWRPDFASENETTASTNCPNLDLCVQGAGSCNGDCEYPIVCADDSGGHASGKCDVDFHGCGSASCCETWSCSCFAESNDCPLEIPPPPAAGGTEPDPTEGASRRFYELSYCPDWDFLPVEGGQCGPPGGCLLCNQGGDPVVY